MKWTGGLDSMCLIIILWAMINSVNLKVAGIGLMLHMNE